MITIYAGIKKQGTILLNDWFFDSFTFSKVLYDETLKKVISEVEGVEFADPLFISKFNDMPIDLTHLSTGCKTLVNILVFPEKIFSVDECGSNVLKQVYSLKGDYSIYCNTFDGTGCYEIENDYHVITPFGEKDFLCCMDISTFMYEMEKYGAIGEMEASL